jgi:type IV secretory pathway VirB10-like protein
MSADDRIPPPGEPGPLHDHRVTPRGVLPRNVQTWAMVAVAGAMLLVIVITGRPNAPRRPADAASSPATASALPPDRLRRYQEQLTEQEARLRKELADAQASAAATPPVPAPTTAGPQTDPLADERRRREYASLFAESVAFTRRAAGTAAPAQSARARSDDSPLTEAISRAALAATAPPPARAAAAPPEPPLQPSAQTGAHPAAGPSAAPPTASQMPAKPPEGNKRVLEGSVIEAVLTNRLEGSSANPVNAQVTTPVYDATRQIVLIPAGARVLGTASPVQELGETRLAVRFHRLVMPDGTTYDLDQFTGLNERGDAGLSDQVNRHYLQIFGASIALGSLSGLAQFATRNGSSADYGFSDAFGQGMGASLATSSGRVLDRFLNVLPSVTIREGHRLKIYLTRDLDLPPYHDPSIR